MGISPRGPSELAWQGSAPRPCFTGVPLSPKTPKLSKLPLVAFAAPAPVSPETPATPVSRFFATPVPPIAAAPHPPGAPRPRVRSLDAHPREDVKFWPAAPATPARVDEGDAGSAASAGRPRRPTWRWAGGHRVLSVAADRVERSWELDADDYLMPHTSHLPR